MHASAKRLIVSLRETIDFKSILLFSLRSLLFLLEKVLLKQMIVVFIIHEKFLLIFYFLQYTILLWGNRSFLQKLCLAFSFLCAFFIPCKGHAHSCALV